ncbi:AraC family chitin signaling transcriptional activator [Chryseobacterium sp. SORGH_AS 447]|uniref:sensor histidine kinase n=1 Tax=Chryseobacterium sp. SORGH_AS_0447 TaxID=3041769 RepID=UPI00277DEE8D|nr:HAMP domain-containing sensor histidine kinase [Chryseobacterium sp. SORGH_AS_0447]MDQ1162672.1 AraC family chitin signaling transcriptional activator [Chryseobacterium sp. SORGH_AS_0447]
MKFCYCILLLFSLFSPAQNFTSDFYSMDNGLPQNGIKDIIKDRYGFLWLSTDGGIVRYDGKNFIAFNHINTKNLVFENFLKSPKNDIICFNNNAENCILIAERTVKVLPEGKVEKTYYMHGGKQYKRYYKNRPTGEFFPETNSYYVKTDSATYIFNNQNIICRRTGKPDKNIFSDFRFNRLKNAFAFGNTLYFPDIKNRRTLILKDGSISYDSKPSLFNHPQSKIYWHQGTGQVLVINSGNIYYGKRLRDQPVLQFLLKYDDIDKQFLSSLFFDEESRQLYLGSLIKGLQVIRLSAFYIPQKNIPFTNEAVYEALPFGKRSVITKSGFEYRQSTVKRIFTSNPNYDRRFMAYDHSRNILYVDFNKIHRRYSASQYKKHDSISFPGRNVDALFKINQSFAVSMADLKYRYYDLFLFDNDRFNHSKKIFRSSLPIVFVRERDKSSIYVGTGNGIYLLSLSDHTLIKHFGKGIPVKEIQQTADGNFWLTTYNRGFFLIKNDRLFRMPYDRNGYLASAHHLLQDRFGFYWISSNNGLFKVSRQSLLNFAVDKKSKVTYYRFTKDEGLRGNEFNGSSSPSGTILPDGNFVFPSMEGFVFFKPEEVKTHYPEKGQLFLERAQVDQKKITFKDTLRIRSDYRTAEIYLDFPYYYNTDNIYLEARLSNSKSGVWETIRNDRRFSLNALPPGNYTLSIRFLTSERGVFAYKSLFIEIQPLFYQTWFFKVLMILLVIAFIAGIVYVNTHYLISINRKLKENLNSEEHKLKITETKLQKEYEYQQKIIESISHDITTPIRFIVSISQQLNHEKDAELQKQYFNEIYKTSEQLFKFTSDLKEYTKLFKETDVWEDEEYPLSELLDDKRLLFEQMAASKKIDIIKMYDASVKIKTSRRILAPVIHNILDNAVKNTEQGHITIRAVVVKNAVEITIFDTGKGMSREQITYYSEVFKSTDTEKFVFKDYGLGLHMVIQLIKKMHAEISFTENKPAGTVVKIRLFNEGR